MVFAIQLALHRSDVSVVAIVVATAAAVASAAALVLFERRRRRRRENEPVTDEWRARALMEELCPHGWQAQITLYGWEAPVPGDAPAGRTPPVSLEWTEFREDGDSGERVAVQRRVWAATIPQALDAMVVDRRTDLTLEQIERESGLDAAED